MNKIKTKFYQWFISFISFSNGLLQYFGNTSCHYQAKISKEKTNIINSNT